MQTSMARLRLPQETPQECKQRPSFENRPYAAQVSSGMLGRHQVRTKAYLCSNCGAYHLKYGGHIDDTNRRILEMIALGYRTEEMAADLRLKMQTIDNRISEMCSRFSALSRAHLASIAITSGIINIANKIARVEEETK